MGSVDGCTDKAYPFATDGEVQWLSAVPYGDPREGWETYSCLPPERCHDCACVVGEVHHWGCDMARCPNCEQQFLGCDCDMPDVFDDAA
jgi:hypothetical protein